MQDKFTVNIRLMELTDLDFIMHIEQQKSTFDWSRQLFISCLELYNSYVATIEEQVVGFGIILVNANIKEAHILNIGVDSSWQRQKIGSKILEFLINSCIRLVAKIFLEVWVLNDAAINLYKKFGFEIIGIRKNYYITANGRQDALTLMLTC